MSDLNLPISVLMPVYNGETFLNEAIDSVLNQTFKNFEFIIINDGSTDNSEKIILSYQDSRIVYIKNDLNLKLIETLNKGIRQARGKYIVRMDADDICLPTRFQKQYDFMELNPNVGVCGSWLEYMSKITTVHKYESDSEAIKLKMLYQCHMAHPTVIIRKSVLDKYHLFYNAEFLHAEDYEFWSSMLDKTDFANIPEVLLRYRVHNNNITNKHGSTQRSKSLEIMKKLFLKYFNLEATEQDLLNYEKVVNGKFKFFKNDNNKAIRFLAELKKNNTLFNTKIFYEYLDKNWLKACLKNNWFIFILYYKPIQGNLNFIERFKLYIAKTQLRTS